jgi:hypothetical protein
MSQIRRDGHQPAWDDVQKHEAELTATWLEAGMPAEVPSVVDSRLAATARHILAAASSLQPDRQMEERIAWRLAQTVAGESATPIDSRPPLRASLGRAGVVLLATLTVTVSVVLAAMALQRGQRPSLPAVPTASPTLDVVPTGSIRSVRELHPTRLRQGPTPTAPSGPLVGRRWWAATVTGTAPLSSDEPELRRDDASGQPPTLPSATSTPTSSTTVTATHTEAFTATPPPTDTPKPDPPDTVTPKPPTATSTPRESIDRTATPTPKPQEEPERTHTPTPAR